MESHEQSQKYRKQEKARMLLWWRGIGAKWTKSCSWQSLVKCCWDWMERDVWGRSTWLYLAWHLNLLILLKGSVLYWMIPYSKAGGICLSLWGRAGWLNNTEYMSRMWWKWNDGTSFGWEFYIVLFLKPIPEDYNVEDPLRVLNPMGWR